MKEVTLFTDGSCLGNPGPGGWACILRYGKHERILRGVEPHTTNNRMELVAAINGLRALTEACRVTAITDSRYLQQGMTMYLVLWLSTLPAVLLGLIRHSHALVLRHSVRSTRQNGSEPRHCLLTGISGPPSV